MQEYFEEYRVSAKMSLSRRLFMRKATRSHMTLSCGCGGVAVYFWEWQYNIGDG